MVIHNRTVFEISFTWDRIRFEATRNKYRVARKLIETSINVQFEKQLRGVFSHNIDIEANINEINERLLKCHDKLRILDNMIELASQSLRIYFDKRMENVRAIIKEHCNVIQQIISEEADHWKEIHAVMDQHLLNPGDIRSRNNYPQTIQKSPASNIETIEEEEQDDEEHVSKLLNNKTLTPLLTQMIRKSRLQSKRLTIIPSIKIHIPIEQEHSIPKKQEEFSMHIIPFSTIRQQLDIVDTTFVVKPDDTIMDDIDEPNGTYRAYNQNYQLTLPVPQPETSLIDSQPNIPARLCFSPTILQDATVTHEDNIEEQSSSENERNEERSKEILLPIDQNQTRKIDNNRHFGQTFLLDIVKTEQIDNHSNDYIRPTITDNDVLVVTNTKPSENINPLPKLDLPVQKEIVKPKSRTRVPVKTKSKPVIVSARKTRSAAKVIAEREAAAAAVEATKPPPVEKSTETKRKTRKRKQSKSMDRPVETSDEDNQPSNSTNNRRKTKRRKKSKTEYHSPETSDDDNNHRSSSINKRKTQKRSKSKRNDQQQEIVNENENSKRKTRKLKEQDILDNQNEKIKRKKTKVSTNDNEEKPAKAKKRKQKTKKAKSKDDEEQISKSSKRTPRSN